jgi:hypothetical protein
MASFEEKPLYISEISNDLADIDPLFTDDTFTSYESPT